MINFPTHIISRFRGKKILVIGDIILDQYIHGAVERISPEAPVPVVLQEGEARFTPGGAANVANNLSSLGARVVLSGQVGDDLEARILYREFKKRCVGTAGLIKDLNGMTSLKTRIIAQHQQVVRVDRENGSGVSPEASQKILAFIEKNFHKFDAIILSDYGKGVITRDLVRRVCALKRRHHTIVTVDPKVEHFNYYHQATCITPNRKETENAIRNIIITHEKGRQLKIRNDKLKTIKDVRLAGQEILNYLNLESLLVTLGEQGMCLFQKGQEPFLIATKAKEVFDVTGAGDTVISVFTLSLAAGASKQEAAILANYAAGVVVGKTGAVAVTPNEILAAMTES